MNGNGAGTKWFVGVLVLIIIAITIAVGALFFFSVFQPVELPPFEIGNFFGKAEMDEGVGETWIEANRGGAIGVKTKLRTDAGSEVDFGMPGKIFLRLKENSQVEGRPPLFYERNPPYRLHLERGNLLATIEKQADERPLEISSPTLVASASKGAVFRMGIDKAYGIERTWVGVLRGEVTVRNKSLFHPKSVVLRGLERAEASRGLAPTQPVRVSRDDWNIMKEAYELVVKGSLPDADQLDMSRKAGGYFENVFDHGTFFTPKIGFCNRDFMLDENSGEIYLQVEYDVFPTGSFVGVYMKTRDFDISKFKSLKFQLKKDLEEGFPETFRIEMKSKQGIVRAFAPTQFKPEWETIELPLHFAKAAPVDEVTFVFTNDKVGEHKKGLLYFKDFNLVPLQAMGEGPSAQPSSPAASEPIRVVTSEAKKPTL